MISGDVLFDFLGDVFYPFVFLVCLEIGCALVVDESHELAGRFIVITDADLAKSGIVYSVMVQLYN